MMSKATRRRAFPWLNPKLLKPSQTPALPLASPLGLAWGWPQASTPPSPACQSCCWSATPATAMRTSGNIPKLRNPYVTATQAFLCLKTSVLPPSRMWLSVTGILIYIVFYWNWISPGGPSVQDCGVLVFWKKSATKRTSPQSENHNTDSELLEHWENSLKHSHAQKHCTVIHRSAAGLRPPTWASSTLVAEHWSSHLLSPTMLVMAVHNCCFWTLSFSFKSKLCFFSL